MRVVRRVEEDSRRRTHPLQPSGTGDCGKAGAHRLDVELPVRTGAEEGLDRRECERRVRRLMGSVQRQEQFGVFAAQALKREHLSAHRGPAFEYRELRALTGHEVVGLDRGAQEHVRHLRLLDGEHGHRVGRHQCIRGLLDDPGLLPRDGREGVTQIVAVVHRDRGDHGHRSVDHVGGIPPAAHACLDHRDIHRRLGEGRVGHRGEDLELAHPWAVGRE